MKFVVFGGGGKVAQHFARLASAEGHEVLSVVRNDTHSESLEKVGAKPVVLSFEDASVGELTSFLTENKPDVVIFSAGAAGDKTRTMKVDYEGSVKVFDAMENANVKRLLHVGAIDIRSDQKAYPDYYNEESKKLSDQTFKAIPLYYEAKLKSELELRKRRALKFTVIRPGGLTLEPAGGVELGRTQVKKTSRELVAKTLLAVAKEPGTEGLTIDVMDGEGELESELKKVVDEKIDSWTG